MLPPTSATGAGKRLRAARARLRLSTREQALVGLPHTYWVTPTLGGPQSTLVAPLELRDRVDFGTTNLVSRMFESWGEIPVTLLQHMDWRNSLYGYIGIEDNTLYPLLRPGSFVQIDSHQNKVQPDGWRDEFERPIYFVELRDIYVCRWCEVNGSQLVLLPSA